MLKRLWRTRAMQLFVGRSLARYLRLVRATSRVTIPPDAYATVENMQPAILAMWHGQHLMVPFLKRPGDRVSVMISRHGDGEVNAIAAACFDIGLVRGSGSQRGDQIRKRGGSAALRAMLSTLSEGINVSLTADVPKIARVAGAGTITIAQLSGRPIFPVAVVTSRRIDVKSWDRASVGLPFGHITVEIGDAIHVARDADAEAQEQARRALEEALDAVHRRAYERVGSQDPGAGWPQVAAARLKARQHGPGIAASPRKEPA